MQQNKRRLGILLALLMVGSIFAIAIAAADPEESQTKTLDNESGIIPDAPNMNDIPMAVGESNEKDSVKVGLTRVTYGQGWAISGNSGYLTNVLWVSQWFSKFEKPEAQKVRDRIKDKNISLKEARDELKVAANETLMKRSAGRLKVGIGKDMTVFKLTGKEVTNTSVTFDVLPISAKKNDSSESIGTLELSLTELSNMKLWKGTLTINSGEKSGTYDVSLGADSAQIRGLARGEGNKNGQEGGNNENNGSDNGKKVGFWGRIGNLFKRNK